MQDISKLCIAKYSIKRIAISHRIGTVHVGEASVIIAVSSTHRKAALEVNESSQL